MGVPHYKSAGDLLGYIVSLSDITTLKNMETELRNHRDNLEDLIDMQTKDLIESMKDAEEANRVKSEFLSNMSHELRTPMHAILAFSRQGAERTDVPRIKEFFNDIHTSGQRLTKLVNNLLDVSKLEAGKMLLAYEPCNIADALSHSINELESLTLDKKLNLYTEIEENIPQIDMDNEKIIQVIVNLISNSIKYTDAGKNIYISIKRAPIEDKDGIAFSIRDEGSGLPEEELEKIFDKFIQGSRTKDGAGGTGLGLAISKEIIKLHKGKIWAENSPKGGAIFTFIIPIKTEETQWI